MAENQKPEEFELMQLNVKDEALTVKYNPGDGDPETKECHHPMHEKLKKLFIKAKTHLREYNLMPKDADKDLTVTKIKVNEYADQEGQSIQIEGVYKHRKSGQNTPKKTSKIQTHGDVYGTESDLKKLVQDFAAQSFEYVYDKKHATSDQTSIED